MSWPKPFGTLPDGREVSAVQLTADDGLLVEILDYGAVVRRLETPAPGGRRNVVLGFDSLQGYLDDRAYQGCVVGRCANRIGKATFVLDGTIYRLAANEGLNILHGGPEGFSRRLWSWLEVGERRAVLAYVSPNLEEGFPGEVDATIAFSLVGNDALEIVYEARTDRPTPVNLTHHLYFNLTGDPAQTIQDHVLTIAAPTITPVRADLIPTGRTLVVGETPFNFLRARRIGDALAMADDPQLALAGGIDHNFMLTQGADPAVRLAAPDGTALEIVTDQPGLQVYTGQHLGQPFAPYAGVALEPQGYPDAPNRPEFPSVILRPGETYRRRTLYRFSA